MDYWGGGVVEWVMGISPPLFALFLLSSHLHSLPTLGNRQPFFFSFFFPPQYLNFARCEGTHIFFSLHKTPLFLKVVASNIDGQSHRSTNLLNNDMWPIKAYNGSVHFVLLSFYVFCML